MSVSRRVSLTGIKPTGEPHLGNLAGAIWPALKLADSYDAMYFVADYHALTSVRDPGLLRHYTRSVAATWLAAGLDPDKILIYRQSDIPETFELSWVLSCVTSKGLMNRAHAYKAAREKYAVEGDYDAHINLGLYSYPVLMAADILLMDCDVVPVGRDQAQHVEYAADIATSFNNIFGTDDFKLKLPRLLIPTAEKGGVLPGLDGRKMSKSYGNTIPLFVDEKQLRKLVRKIVSDSKLVEEAKDPDSSNAYQILEQFASDDLLEVTRRRLEEGGMGWGELKDQLFEVLNAELGPLRIRYNELMEPGSELEQILQEGASKARARAKPVIEGVREATGVR